MSLWLARQNPKAEPVKADQNKPADEPESEAEKKPESVVTTRGISPNQTVVKAEDDRPKPVRKPKPPEPEKKPEILPPEKTVAKKETAEPQQPVTEPSKGNTAQDMIRTADVAGLTDQRPLVTEPLFNGAQRKPAYPYMARKRGQQGTVLLEVFLDKQGHVESVTLVDSSGFSLLDRAAERAVRRWSFRPLVRDGVALSSRVRGTGRFQAGCIIHCEHFLRVIALLRNQPFIHTVLPIIKKLWQAGWFGYL